MLFLWIAFPWKFHSISSPHPPPCLFFFWNRPFALPIKNRGGQFLKMAKVTGQLAIFLTFRMLRSKMLEHVYMRPEVNWTKLENSNYFLMLFCLHGNLQGDFTAATYQTIARLIWFTLHMCKSYLLINANLMQNNRYCTIGCFLNNSSKAHDTH